MSRPNDPPKFAVVHRGRSLTAVALLALTALVGCSGNPESAAPTERGTSAVPATVRSTLPTASMPSGTSGASGTTGTAVDGLTADEQVVADAYTNASHAYAQAASASDPNGQSFKSSYAAQYLRELQILIQQRTENGQAVRDARPSKARTSFVSVTVAPPTAALITCEVDDRVVFKVADGSVVNDKVTTDRWSTAMTDEDGTWKISGRHQVQTWDGEEMAACLGSPKS